MQVEVGALSHPGHRRPNNEDHYLVSRFGRLLETLLTNLPPQSVPMRSQEVGYGIVVADGVGGASGGEVASSTAISTLVSLVLQTPDWILGDESADADRVMARMAERFHLVRAALAEQVSNNPGLARMATTLTLAASLGESLIIGHIGDSRAYLLRGDELLQLTRDHTLVQLLVDQGRLTPEEAIGHPKRHVLTRTLSAVGRDFDGDFRHVVLESGDQLLLCTDGLTAMVDDFAIRSILLGAASADEACRNLVDAALNNGGVDNVTVALARYELVD
jgi:PPM family protein phosphatase